MFSWPALSFVLTGCAIILLLWAALHDLAARTVPNALPAAILAAGLTVRLIDHSMVISVMFAAAIFIVLFTIWLTGAIGGGDVKLWSASILLIPPHWQMELSCFTRILMAGGVLALAYLFLRIIEQQRSARPSFTATSLSRQRPNRETGLATRIIRAEAWRISRKAPLPYAFAIASGIIVTLLPVSFPGLR